MTGARRLALALLLATLATPAAARERIAHLDALGRRTGSVEVRPDGRATFRDVLGRKTGTAEPGPGGSTTLRDAQGRRTGTLEGFPPRR